MRRIALGALSLVILCEFLCGSPLEAGAGIEPGISIQGGNSLAPCQSQFAEALRAIEREREYTAEKSRYQEALSRRCAGEKWYDLGFLECALFVPLFGIVLPFFGIILFGSVRSALISSPPRNERKVPH